jgi:hypothetical protein
VPAPAAALTQSQLEVKHLIRHVFPHHYRAAQRVAYCESRYDRHAANGQHEGVFQLSESWRLYFRALHPRWHDVAYTAAENVRAAHGIVRGQGWAPWSCGWAAYDTSQPR